MINQKTEIVLGDKDLIITNYVNTKEKTAALLFAAGIIDTLKERQSLEGTFVKSIEDVTHQARIVFKSLEDIENLIGMLKELKKDYQSLTGQTEYDNRLKLISLFENLGAKRSFYGCNIEDYILKSTDGVNRLFRLHKYEGTITIYKTELKNSDYEVCGVPMSYVTDLEAVKNKIQEYELTLINENNGTAGI